MTNNDKLQEVVVRIVGNNKAKQLALLQDYSSFTNGEGKVIFADDIRKMSSEWARVTLNKILDAIKEHAERFRFDEHGVEIKKKGSR